MDAIQVLSDYAVKTKYEHLPTDVTEKTKHLILDTIGVAIAGSTSPGTIEVMNLVKKWGGKSEATVWIYGTMVPSFHAAFANSVLIHARELDDTHDLARGHANVSILPASLAVAEAEGMVSGKELLTAIVISTDIMFRIGYGMRDYYGWHNTSTLGAFAAGAAAAKILRLNEEMMLNCLGIVYSQVSGNHQCLVEGSIIKRFQPAFSSMAGVRSAYLAKEGIDGPKNILQGKYGYYNLYGRGKYDPEEITKNLGDRFEVMNLSFKPYPSCRFTHASVGAVLDLLNTNPINPSEIGNVTIKCTKLTKDLVGRPFELGDNPQVSAQFSLPYTVATALLKKDLFIEDFENRNVGSQKVQELAKIITVEIDESIPDQVLPVPLTIIINLKNGQQIIKNVKAIKGSPVMPLTEGEIINKFKKCIQYSKKPITERKSDQIINLCLELDQLKNIKVLTEVLKV